MRRNGRAEIVLPNETATKTIGVTVFNRVGQVDHIAFAIVPFGKGRALLLVSQENEHQLTEAAQVDILQTNIDPVLVERTDRRGDIRVVLTGNVSNPEFADTHIDVSHTGSVPGVIQVEVIVRIHVEPVVEAFATPEGDLWRALKDVSHLQVGFTQSDTEIVTVGLYAGRC